MTIPILNLAKRIWVFANPADARQRTRIMGHPSAGEKSVARFGSLNSEIGGYSENCLDISATLGVVSDFIKSFFSNSESLLLKGVDRVISATSIFFSAKRDQLMYLLFGDGVDGDVYASVKHENNPFDANEVPKLQTQLRGHVDDLAENLGQKQAYGESVVPFFGWLATLSAKVKPIVSPLAAFLPANFQNAIDSTIDLGARSWWRMRMFGTSLHANFLTSMVNLAKNGIMSIGSSKAREDLRTQVTGLGDFAKRYFQAEGNQELANSTTHSSMGLYTKMLADRVRSHWNNVWMDKDELVQNLKNKKVLVDGDPTSPRDLKLMAISELTAPFCSAIGLAGTFIFEPLKILGKFMGIERGMNLINALSTSRKATHLFNYIFRFIVPEINGGRDTIKALEECINNNTATEIQRQLYFTAKTKERNGIFGMFVASGNIVEPIMHLLGLGNSENNLTKFAFNLFTRFNDTGLLRFFSTRRHTFGNEAIIRSIAMNKGLDIRNMATELGSIKMTKEEIEAYSSKVYEKEKVHEHLSSVVDPIIKYTEATKSSIATAQPLNPSYAEDVVRQAI